MPRLGVIRGVICKKPKGALQCRSRFICLLCLSQFVWTCRFVTGFSATPSRRKWTSEACCEPHVKQWLFLIKQPRYQPLPSDHDVLIRFKEADWCRLSGGRIYFSPSLPLRLRIHCCIFIKAYLFIFSRRVFLLNFSSLGIQHTHRLFYVERFWDEQIMWMHKVMCLFVS